MAKPILFRCPATGLRVQGQVEAEPPADGSVRYEPVTCIACRQVHLVNVASGRLRSEEADG